MTFAPTLEPLHVELIYHPTHPTTYEKGHVRVLRAILFDALGRPETTPCVTCSRELKWRGGARAERVYVRHADGDRGNSDLSNLLVECDRCSARRTRGWIDGRCPEGHDITDEENVYGRPGGGRECRLCRRVRQRRWWHENCSPKRLEAPASPPALIEPSPDVGTEKPAEELHLILPKSGPELRMARRRLNDCNEDARVCFLCDAELTVVYRAPIGLGHGRRRVAAMCADCAPGTEGQTVTCGGRCGRTVVFLEGAESISHTPTCSTRCGLRATVRAYRERLAEAKRAFCECGELLTGRAHERVCSNSCPRPERLALPA